MGEKKFPLKFLIFFCCCCCSCCCFFSYLSGIQIARNPETPSGTRCLLPHDNIYLQDLKKPLRMSNVPEGGMGGRARRLLGGPGSSPPRCTSKCGSCTPCNPVHVPVPPGTPVKTEYYPEAWRCKCGNKLYLP